MNEIESEYINQIAYLEQSVNNFRQNIKKDSDLHKMDHRNYIRENIKLIKEILSLRKELKNLKSSEKPETILLRKQKKLRNIISKKERELTVQEKEQMIEE